MNPTASQVASTDNLALLYQGLLTSVVRVRSGSQPINDPNEFRRRAREVLAGVEREAVRIGYRSEDIRNTNYAIVAFLDESVLDSNDPNRNAWSALQSEMYGDAVAGDSFFDQLEYLRRRQDSPELADILEVYYLCLLLGYRGRYAGHARDRASELNRMMDDLRTRIENVRGRDLVFWPGPMPGLVTKIAGPTDSITPKLKRLAMVAAIGAVVLWVLCFAGLYWQASSAAANLG